MKRKLFLITIVLCAMFLAAGTTVWGAKGGIPGKPPPNEDPPPETPIDDFYFWRWGHMDGPHDSAKALGISRDGRTAVGSTVVVDFERAWRSDIDWAIATDDGVPPLYNELQVQEDIGVIAPSRPSAAYASSDMTYDADRLRPAQPESRLGRLDARRNIHPGDRVLRRSMAAAGARFGR